MQFPAYPLSMPCWRGMVNVLVVWAPQFYAKCFRMLIGTVLILAGPEVSFQQSLFPCSLKVKCVSQVGPCLLTPEPNRSADPHW